ncbi:ACP S-malonyltransferase [Lacticigenium naphthae]|uniref:ACP S-malonyltransferase n=1 Tax=Lacticigenium naphthae TaxID=515351 RepID=UPI00042925B3|nr:ACP S-malonyltransferase [Lacticigenium naphthae]
MTVAFIYSGQGSQYSGMGLELYDTYPQVKKVIDKASSLLNLDFVQLYQNEEKLNWTPYTQPAILALSFGIDRLLRDNGFHPEVVAGLSLGEYTALTSADVFRFDQVIPFVHERGKAMTEAYPSGGAMSAVLGAEKEKVESVCKDISNQAYVAPANYNMPGQIVIAGTVDGVRLASEELSKEKRVRCIQLQVSGPFHTALLEPASKKIEKLLQNEKLQKPAIPVYANTHAKSYETIEEIKETLVEQVQSPVRFEEMIEKMISDGVDCFVEIGPGKTLSRFIKKINRSVVITHVDDEKSLQKTLTVLKEYREEFNRDDK